MSATENAARIRFHVSQELVLLVALAIALAVLSVTANRFMTVGNLLNQGRLMTEVALVALPMTFIIITGGIDLSVGSIMGLTAILLGVFWKNVGIPLPFAVLLSIVAASAAGFFNGLLITRVRVPPLIMTLATLALYRGLAEGISQARSVRGYPEWFFVLGQGEVLGIPTQLWLLFVAVIVFWVILSRTTFGRSLYAIGHNETAARYSAIKVDRIKLVIYTLSGLMAGIAGAIFVSRVSTTRSDMGTGPGARRDRGGGARRHVDLRRHRHDRRHGARLHPDPAPEERAVAHRRQRATPPLS